MKYLLISISLICTINCFAQDLNPNLFQTWYLNFVQATDMDTPYEVSEIVPSITPYLTISENLDFNGVGACNSFYGNFNSSTSNTMETWETNTFSNTTVDCGIQVLNSFENSYFGFIQLGGWYEITTEGTGMVLTINHPLMGQAVFKNFTLNSLDFDLDQIDIYPNPTSSNIFIKTQNTFITKIELFNSLGQEIKVINDNFETIDISDLSTGVYIMKISSKLGTLNKKILKK